MDIGTGKEVLLATGAIGGYQPAISNDGHITAYVAKFSASGAAQMFVVNTDGAAKRQLTDVPEGISEAALSGYGDVVYAVTNAGRLLRIDVISGNVRQLIGRTPDAVVVDWPDVPGSLARIYGTGLSEAGEIAQAPLPDSLAGTQVKSNNKPVPLLFVSPSEIFCQVPFETPLENTSIEVATGDPTFENMTTRQISKLLPTFVMADSLDAYSGLILHTNFDALVTSSNPARPGEIVHFYMRGLGPVNPALPTGQPGPSDPPATLAKPLRCTVGETPLEILFAGMAPGMFGVYQVTLKLPAAVGSTTLQIFCGFPDVRSDSISVPIKK